MPYTDAEQAAALEIARRRRIRWRWLPGGRCVAVRDVAGREPTAIAGSEADDPVGCLQAAEAAIIAGEQRDAETRARRLFDAYAQGTYSPWPRQRADGSIDWLVLRAADRQPVAGPFPGLLAALLELARLIDQPPAPAGDEL